MVMFADNTALKYKTPHKVPFVITQYWENSKVALQGGTKQARHNVRWFYPYKSDTNVGDNKIEEYVRRCQNMITRYIPLYYILKIGNKLYN